MVVVAAAVDVSVATSKGVPLLLRSTGVANVVVAQVAPPQVAVPPVIVNGRVGRDVPVRPVDFACSRQPVVVPVRSSVTTAVKVKRLSPTVTVPEAGTTAPSLVKVSWPGILGLRATSQFGAPDVADVAVPMLIAVPQVVFTFAKAAEL